MSFTVKGEPNLKPSSSQDDPYQEYDEEQMAHMFGLHYEQPVNTYTCQQPVNTTNTIPVKREVINPVKQEADSSTTSFNPSFQAFNGFDPQIHHKTEVTHTELNNFMADVGTGLLDSKPTYIYDETSSSSFVSNAQSTLHVSSSGQKRKRAGKDAKSEHGKRRSSVSTTGLSDTQKKCDIVVVEDKNGESCSMRCQYSYLCLHCSFKSDRKFNVKRHSATVHAASVPDLDPNQMGEKQLFLCLQCNFGSERKFNVKRHMQTVHSLSPVDQSTSKNKEGSNQITPSSSSQPFPTNSVTALKEEPHYNEYYSNRTDQFQQYHKPQIHHSYLQQSPPLMQSTAKVEPEQHWYQHEHSIRTFESSDSERFISMTEF